MGLRGYRVTKLRLNLASTIHKSEATQNSKLETRNYLKEAQKKKRKFLTALLLKTSAFFVDNFMLRPQENILHASERLMSVANCVDRVRAEA